MVRASGKVWLVGAGPGEPGLITVRGLEVLATADVVLHDALSHPDLLACCRSDAEIIDVGKRAGERYPAQHDISGELIEHARQGKTVVRLKGGDPFVFARGAEEASDLAEAGVPFEVVPGVSSPVAASAYAGISLTHRDLSNSVTFITGSDRRGKEWSSDAWKRLATATATICVLMGMRRLAEITRAIIDGGRPEATPAAVIQWGARPEQRVVTATLGTIADEAKKAGLKNPAVVIIGEVAELRDRLRWYDNRPLFGRRILVPRAAHQARETARAIAARAASPVLFPVIEMHDPPDPEPLRRAAADLGAYDWVLFTSANGVERFFAELRRAGRDARALGGARVGAIGPKTAAALSSHGVTADVTAKEFVGESLAEEVVSRGGARRVLVPRALVAREDLPRILREAGAEVDVVPAYETRPVPPDRAAELARALGAGEVDVVLFTSGSTVSSVVDLLGDRAAELLQPVTVASIGPITSAALEARGLRADVTAAEYTIEGLLDALEEEFGEGG